MSEDLKVARLSRSVMVLLWQAGVDREKERETERDYIGKSNDD